MEHLTLYPKRYTLYPRDMGTPRYALVALAFLTAVSVFAVGAMILTVDPDYATGRTMASFYVSMFGAIAGVAAWTFMLLRAKAGRTKRPVRLYFGGALRQGMLIAGIVIASLLLQASRNLSFIWVLLLAIAAVGIEAWATRQAKT